MPNGGSDNCGTCWFSARNKGEARSAPGAIGPDHCTIRDVAIECPLWTYCNNHPHHRHERDAVPIGPVWECGDGYPYRRKVLYPSPDTEEIRLHLLELLREIKEVPPYEYGTVYTDEVVVWQLGEFKEARALPELERIAAFIPTEKSIREVRSRAAIVRFANEAIRKIHQSA